MSVHAFRLASLAALSLTAACSSQGENAPTPSQAAPDPAAAPSAPAAAPAVTAIDPARLSDPCLLPKDAVAKVLGAPVSTTEPETMGTMLGCTYKGGNASLRLNLIVHDPVYFAQATAATKGGRPGDKTDIPGDADKAWWQTGDGPGTVLHYYRQNVEVEVIPLGLGGDSVKLKPLLEKLPRVP